MDSKTAVCLLSDSITNDLESKLKLLKASLTKANDIILFYYGENEIEDMSLFEDYGIKLWCFTYESLIDKGFVFYNPRMLNRGSNHMPLLQFMNENEEYDYAWLVEDKVFFNGDWNIFFESFIDETCDFISAHIERYEDWTKLHGRISVESNIEWYGATNQEDLSGKSLIKTFNVIFRLSKLACKFLYQNRGTFAGLGDLTVATQLYNNGYSMLDMGGGLTFSNANKYHFYEFNDQNLNSTLRAHDTWQKDRITRPNILYYPYSRPKARIRNYKKSNEINVALCCIAKNENLYIREWVEHYISLGFNKIYINDNNDINGERLEDVISDYIDNGLVEIIDVRGRYLYMFEAYNGTYHKYGKYHDWMAFFDCDEFLSLEVDKTIQDYLSRDLFIDYDAVYVNWRMYGDNNLVYYDDRPVQERFSEPLPVKFFLFEGAANENRMIKTIIRTGIDDIAFFHPHYPRGSYEPCTSIGTATRRAELVDDCFYKYAVLKHYRTKTAEEYINKILRGYPDLNMERSTGLMSKKIFYKYNLMTEEKDEMFRALEKKTQNNTTIYICTHKDWDYPTDSTYEIVCGPNDVIRTTLNVIKENIENNPYLDKQPYYGEMTRIYHIWKNVNIKDYVGFSQYRHRFNFGETIPDFEHFFKTYDVFACPMTLPTTIREHYGHYHSIKDLETLGEIIKKYYPKYYKTFKIMLSGHLLYVCNMFVMKKNDFYKYCEFVFGVMDKFDEKMGFKTMEDINRHILANEIDYLMGSTVGRNNSIDYQNRMGGFLCERLTSLYIMHNFKNVNNLEFVTNDVSKPSGEPLNVKEKKKLINTIKNKRRAIRK